MKGVRAPVDMLRMDAVPQMWTINTGKNLTQGNILIHLEGLAIIYVCNALEKIVLVDEMPW